MEIFFWNKFNNFDKLIFIIRKSNLDLAILQIIIVSLKNGLYLKGSVGNNLF